ncbi:hypothetical protein [Leminorella grimontii]|uniref:hypothetical protein n=1 Tax=Leminorella grimontii TaxID=82981 RepID=UPI0020890E2A|nr:hypothetical protein [Leminorella grimontii]GKX58737.1 hypothetical protein SOASR031_10520 [Leminorella grimontii]
MPRYANIRGWLECSFDDVNGIRLANERFLATAHASFLTSEQIALYGSGWHYPSGPINWASYVFYGACVNVSAVEFIKEMIMNAVWVNQHDIEGFFVIDIEDEGQLHWTWSDGQLTENKR